MIGPCINYAGRINDQGYGRAPWDNGSTRAAHVIAWELFRGPVLEGLQLDHLCRNRACINPNHLEPVTSRVNTLRGEGPTAINARKDVCSRGHALAGDNLRVDKHGKRFCRTCQREHEKAYQARNVEVLREKARARWHRKAALAKVTP